MFCQNLEISLNVAFNFAKDHKHEFMTVEHLLLALLDNPEALLVFNTCQVNTNRLRVILKEYLNLETPSLHARTHLEIQPTLAFQRVLQRAIFQVQAMSKTEVNGANVLAAIFNEQESQAVYLLNQENITRRQVIDCLTDMPVGFINEENHDFSIQNYHEEHDSVLNEDIEMPESDKMIDKYAQNLNLLIQQKKIDPLIGRKDEIDRMIQTLCRRQKNNPLLIGESGVGKTALVEGLAQRIVDGKVPDLLSKSTIFNLDLGLLLAGTKYRGDFEKRFKNLLKELSEMPNVIVFIDEIHTIVGAGAASGGAIDAANLLKPLLGRGHLRCLGATTYQEYRNIFEKDKALARRFQKLDVLEPDESTAIKMLLGIKKQFESYHRVHYTDEAIKSAVHLSIRHIHDRFLPDKAIDVIDEAGALQKTLPVSKRKKIIDSNDIEKIVALIARIPSKQVSQSDKLLLKNLESKLEKNIFGQDQAIEALVHAIKVSRSGLRTHDRPIGNFLFTGPTGVGKTEVCIQLAQSLGVKLLRFDMSEYMEKHTVSQLIGAPAGYVGFEQGGQLTDAVHKHPYSVLLLDEVEKAHPDLLNILLQVMDHGELMDNNGEQINFRNTIIVMTSNTGSECYDRSSVGFTDPDHQPDIMESVKRSFSPEFRNRLDAMISFQPLDEKIVIRIVDKFIKELRVQLSDKSVDLKITQSAKKWLAQHGYHTALGARPLSRLIDQEIKYGLADDLLFGKLMNGGLVKIKASGTALEVKTEKLIA
jgi:ATP-dependent Clp protease ATP-binding subunit ClpA